MEKLIIKDNNKIIESRQDLRLYNVKYNNIQIPIEYFYNSKKYVIHPVFQRHFVWSKKQKSNLIETILTGMPMPNIYTYLDLTNNQELIIDGQQRLTTIKKFLNNEFKLSGLENKNLNGFDYYTLPQEYKNRIKNYTLYITQIDNLNSKNILYEIFKRFNTGSTKLNAQELRNCIYQGKFNSLIQELTKYEGFNKIFKNKEIDRMEKEEYVLRFFAFYENFDNYKSDIKSFLDEYLSSKIAMNDLSDEAFTVQTNEIVLKFKKAVDLCFAVFGFNVFKYCDNKNKTQKVNYKSLSKSVYDMQMLGFTDFDSELIIRHKDIIKKKYEELVLNNEDMRPSYKKMSKKAVSHRICEWKKEVDNIIKNH